MTVETVALDAIDDLETLESLSRREFLPADDEQLVFGEGPENARFMLIGEAPGKEEAKTGHPFVGNSGRLLNKYLEEAGIDKEEGLCHQRAEGETPGQPDAEKVGDERSPALSDPANRAGSTCCHCLSRKHCGDGCPGSKSENYADSRRMERVGQHQNHAYLSSIRRFSR